MNEPGEIVKPLESGAIDKEHFDNHILVGEIGDVLNGKINPVDHRSDDDITVFESLGIALEDLTAAKAITSGHE